VSESAGHVRPAQSPAPCPSLAELHARYDRWLVRQVRQRFGVEGSEDLVQTTWLKLMGADLGAVRHPKALLLRIASNLAISDFRRTALSRRSAVAPADSEPPCQDETLMLRDVILGLPQPLRDVFLLSRFAGLTHNQIAEKLGISHKTVEWRMRKALEQCAARLRA
jgi:RNA polymerase sigma factor (sigma-70 family)